IGKEKFFQYLDRADSHHESAARNQKGSKTRGRNAGENFRGRALQSPGKSRLEGSCSRGRLAGDWGVRFADVAEENQRDVKVLHELERLYHELGESDREVEIYNQITEINPLDAEALRLGKDASAHASMKSGGWTEAESYRDLIKDKEGAISLEQKSRMRLTGESLDQQIAETYARQKSEPANIDLARRLAALSEQKEDFEAAIGWYQYAADLTKGADAGLIRKVSDLKIKRLEREIAAHEEFLSTHTAADELYG